MLRHYDCEWTDDGAKLVTNIPGAACPRCGAVPAADVEHLCGDRVPKLNSKVKAKVKR